MSTTAAMIASATVAFLLLGTGGNLACRLLFHLTGLKGPTRSTSDPRAGRVIGWLERVMIAIGIVGGSWEVIAAVIALKTVARFKELDKQLPAEYFLVGSLFSLLWAVCITSGWLLYDQRFGANVSKEILSLVKPPDDQSKSEIAAT